MGKTDRHDEIKALLEEIRDRLPEPEGVNAVEDEPTDLTEEPPVGSPVVCRDGEVLERREDGWRLWLDGLGIWDKYRESWEHLRSYASPLRLATPADLARVGIKDEPRPDTCCGKCPPIVGGGYDCTCEGNPKCRCGSVRFGYPDHICTKATGHAGPHEYRGVFWSEPLPADDLPGEPVEPSDLRAGDQIEYDYEGVRYACTLVVVGDFLRSDAPLPAGYTLTIVWGREWAEGISDVRRLERAPREDEDQDEAAVWREHAERAEAEVKRVTAARDALRDDRDVWEQKAREAEDERDALRERYEAFRLDVKEQRLNALSASEKKRWVAVLDRAERRGK